MRGSTLLALTALTAGVASTGCTGPDGHDARTTDPVAVVVDTTALVADPAPDATVEDTIRDEAEEADVVATGGATLTIGDTTWRFPDAVCLFGDDAAQVEADFAMSAVADGYEIYVSSGDDGDVITIDDIGDAAAEPVSMTTVQTSSFVRVTGRTASATAGFVPADDLAAAPVTGTLEIDCGESPAATTPSAPTT